MTDIANHCAKLIRNAHEKRLKEAEKQSKNIIYKGSVDIVTETDQAVEKYVWTTLSKKYPNYSFVGEESASQALDSEPTFVCDPIDGTTNFVHSNPYFCISLAFCVEKKPLAGIVLNPITNECFTAVRGGGAFLNGTRLATAASHDRIATAVVSTNVGYDRSAAGVAHVLDKLRSVMLQKARGIQLNGSAALQMAYVAAGRFDCFYEWGINSWDIAAAVLIVEEAGGVVVGCDGRALDLNARNVLATNGKPLCNEIVKALK